MSAPAPLIAYRAGRLHMEDVPLETIAQTAGTPFFAYSRGLIARRFAAYQAALKPVAERLLICYAVKANANQAVLRVLRNLGAGADLTTGGELERAVAAGFPPDRIVFSGIGKTDNDLKRALELGIRQVNVESVGELERLNTMAGMMGRRMRVAIRLNPQLDTLSRPDYAQITTGKPDSKFGVPWPLVESLLPDIATRFAHVDLAGISVHIGSNFQGSEFTQIERVLTVIRDVYLPTLERHGITPTTLDIGGGVGVNDEDPFQADNLLIAQYGTLVQAVLGDALATRPGLTLITEPGRSLIAEAGLLVAGVVQVKDDMARDGDTGLGVRFVIVDAAMNDLMRPSLYGAYHLIVPVCESALAPDDWWPQVDICGTVCETTDSFMRPLTTALGWSVEREDVNPEALAKEVKGVDRLKTNTDYPEEPPAYQLAPGDGNTTRARFASFVRRRFPPVAHGDLVAITMAGAYGAVLASEFNSRPILPEVLVDGDRFALVRPRRRIEDIIAGEVIPAWIDAAGGA